MRRLLPFIALLLALAAPAMAAPLDDARLAHQTAEKTLAALDQKRAELDRQHERLAVEIEALKTKNDNPLLPGVRSPRLDARLKDARALAERLGALDREVRDANAQVEQTRESLRDHLDAELAHLRLTLAEADAADRRAIFEAMRALVDERGALAAAAPAPSTVTATLPTPPDDEMASPGELRELADEAGDHAEQVRRQLDTLEERLGALEERRRLVRAALAFQRDDSLFGQDERNRRLARRTEGIGTAAPVAGGQNRGDNAGGGGEVAALDDAPKTPSPAPGEAAESPPQRFAGDENPPAQDNADPDDGAQAGGAESDNDGDGVPDQPEVPEAPAFEAGASDTPELGLPPSAEPPPAALPAPGVDDFAGSGGATIIEPAFDATLLDGDVESLSPEAVARRIKALKARRRALEAARKELEARQRSLEDRARVMENQ